MTAIPLIFFFSDFTVSFLIEQYEPMKANTLVLLNITVESQSETKITCCAVVQTFSRSNHDKKVFTWPNATVLMIKYSCVLAEVLVKCGGLER